MDFNEILQSILKLPQTQQDIRTIAKTGEQLQSPEVQQELAQIRTSVEATAATMLSLQVLSTIALGILAWKALSKG